VIDTFGKASAEIITASTQVVAISRETGKAPIQLSEFSDMRVNHVLQLKL
jgi:hypothetical protein